MRHYLLLTASLGLFGLACDPGGVGDPCTPEDEYQIAFSGFSVEQVNVESRSFQCETRVCLVNHFQGRVSCPYGQSEPDAASCQTQTNCLPGSPEYGRTCRIPTFKGESVDERIAVAVEPQLVRRQADDAVYCSCRCDGPDANARYCECPSGFSCTKLVEDIGLGKGQLAGSYCVKNGTEYDPKKSRGSNCSAVTGECGNDGNNP